MKMCFKFFSLVIFFYLLLIVIAGTVAATPVLEFGAYTNYARSIVENHDLNTLNQIPASVAWIVSKTFNYPEMHDYGVALLWAPFFYLVKLLNIKPLFITPHSFALSADYVATYFINGFCALIGIGMLKAWYNSRSQKEMDSSAVWAIILGTGFWYYLIEQYNGTEAVIFFLAIVMMINASNINNNYGLLDFFCLGLLWGFARVVKIHSMSYLLPFAYYFYTQLSETKFLRKLLAGAFFVSGFFLFYVGNEYNNFLKFGFLNPGQGYFEEIFHLFNNPNIFDSFFGSLGLFVQMPVFFFIFLYFLYLCFKWAKNPDEVSQLEKMAVLFYSNVIVKMLVFTATPTSSQSEFGGRNFMIDFGAQILLLAILFQSFSKFKTWHRILKLGVLIGVGWTLMYYFWFRAIVPMFPDQRLTQEIDFSKASISLKMYTVSLRVTLQSFVINLKDNISYLPLATLPALIVFNNRRIVSFMSGKKFLHYGSFSLLFIFIFVTGLNHFNNHKNAEGFRASGRFNKIVIGNGPHIFTFDNMATDMIPSLEHDKHLRDKKRYDLKLAFVRQFMAKAKSEVVFDNIGFVETLDKGLFPSIPLTNDENPNSVLDFYAPERF